MARPVAAKKRTRKRASPESLYRRALRLALADESSNRKRCLELLKRAVEDGHPRAAYALATWYLHGVGVRKDFKKGRLLLERAARADIREAHYDLAVCYETGRGA